MLHNYHVHWLFTISLLLLTACNSDRQAAQQNSDPIPVTSLTATPFVDSPLLAVNPAPALTPPPAPSPTMAEAAPPTLSATFLTAEAEYNGTLQASSPTPPPPPSSTPTPFYAVEPVAQNTQLQRYEGHSGYQETPRFQVTFDSAMWQIVEITLQHRQLAGCTFDLYAASGEVSGPMEEEQVSFGDMTWHIRIFPTVGTISYSGSTEELATFLFGVHYPPAGGSAAETACRSAAEEVLKTFALVKTTTN